MTSHGASSQGSKLMRQAIVSINLKRRGGKHESSRTKQEVNPNLGSQEPGNMSEHKERETWNQIGDPQKTSRQLLFLSFSAPLEESNNPLGTDV